MPVDLGRVLAAASRYEVHLFDSEFQSWRGGAVDTGAALGTPAMAIEAGGFRILRFVEVGDGEVAP